MTPLALPMSRKSLDKWCVAELNVQIVGKCKLEIEWFISDYLVSSHFFPFPRSLQFQIKEVKKKCFIWGYFRDMNSKSWPDH